LQLTLLSEVGLSLLDGCENHITSSGGWETIQARTASCDSDDVQVLTAAVVAAIHDGTDGLLMKKRALQWKSQY
jgi:hypothetical protein